MDLLDTPVRLVVKAPNQRVSDQTIECALSWTVRKLKTYISEVYPNKPKTEEQKLIYSGQLLLDHLTLKDVLRQYDLNNTHIVHLVCTSAKDKAQPSAILPSTIKPKENLSNTNRPTPDTNVGDGLHQRRTETQSSNRESMPGITYPNYSMYGGSMYNNTTPGLTLTPEQMTQQVMWMQQMYTQYLTQYMQYAQANSEVQQITTEDTNRTTVAPVPPVNNPPPRPVPNENIRMNAQGGPVDDDDEEFGPNRDWLDWFYLSSRALALFSIVYFYSSFSRFIAVTLIVIMLYIYRTNWFQRRRRARQAAREDEVAPVVANNARNDDNNNRAQQDAAVAPAANQEQREIENLMDNDLDDPMPPVEMGPSIFTVTWAFISGFFSSLLPEQVAQVN